MGNWVHILIPHHGVCFSFSLLWKHIAGPFPTFSAHWHELELRRTVKKLLACWWKTDQGLCCMVAHSLIYFLNHIDFFFIIDYDLFNLEN